MKQQRPEEVVEGCLSHANRTTTRCSPELLASRTFVVEYECERRASIIIIIIIIIFFFFVIVIIIIIIIVIAIVIVRTVVLRIRIIIIIIIIRASLPDVMQPDVILLWKLPEQVGSDFHEGFKNQRGGELDVCLVRPSFLSIWMKETSNLK